MNRIVNFGNANYDQPFLQFSYFSNYFNSFLRFLFLNLNLKNGMIQHK